MRSDIREFELVTPRNLDEALATMAKAGSPGAPLAGGTDVMVLLSAGKLAPRRFLDIGGMSDLRGIEVEGSAVTFGALTTYTELLRHPVVSRELPMLAQAGREPGGVAIQNRGTLGGNIANASPAADSSPALLAYEASVELASARGRRWVEYASFPRHTKSGAGHRRTDCAHSDPAATSRGALLSKGRTKARASHLEGVLRGLPWTGGGEARTRGCRPRSIAL